MTAIAYAVTASLPDEATRDRYIAWLRSGHLDEVIKAGAEAAVIVIVEEPSTPPQVQTRYTFRTRDAYERYIAHHAPGLRAEGLKLFPPTSGVSFSRTMGRIL
jgi:hypothetical protein